MPLFSFKYSLIVASTAVMLLCLNSGVQAQQQSSFVVPAAQVETVSQARQVIGQLAAKIRRTKSVSDDDLTTLVAFAGEPKQHPLVRVSALSPLTQLKPDGLTGTQLAKIDQLVFAILQEDDKASDLDGLSKTYAASVAGRVVRGKRFLDVLQLLTNDGRETVRLAAKYAYDRIK